MTCFVNQVDIEGLTLYFKSTDSYTTTITETDSGFLSVILTRTVTTLESDSLVIASPQGVTSNPIIIDVVSASLQRMTFKTLYNNLKQTSEEEECEISSPWTGLIVLFDRYSNPIKLKHTSYT